MLTSAAGNTACEDEGWRVYGIDGVTACVQRSERRHKDTDAEKRAVRRGRGSGAWLSQDFASPVAPGLRSLAIRETLGVIILQLSRAANHDIAAFTSHVT